MNTSQLEGIDTVTLSAGSLQAEFAPALGMTAVSLRHRGDELLDRRAGLRAYARTGAVMGVPLLYPWANRLAGHDYVLDGHHVRLPSGPPLVHCEEHGLPIHGLLHASPHWRTTSRDETQIRAVLDFGVHPELLAAFPFPHTLEIGASLSTDRLRITTTIRPTGAAAVPIAFGFHPYLRLPGVPRAAWLLTLPPRRHLVLDERESRSARVGVSPPRGSSSTTATSTTATTASHPGRPSASPRPAGRSRSSSSPGIRPRSCSRHAGRTSSASSR